MYILKNAWISIWRNKARNILISVVILVIACFSAITLSIRSAASKLVDANENKYDITASIGMNRENIRNNLRPSEEDRTSIKIPALTEAQIESYGNSSYVKSYYYTNTVQMNAENLEKASSSFGFEASIGANDKNHTSINNGDFSVVGYSSYEAMSEFISGKYTIIEGNVSDDFDSNDCVINRELAELNDLKVGDIITIVNPNDDTQTYELTITGIYEEKEESGEGTFDMFTGSANTIITNHQIVKTILKSDTTLTSNVNPTFIFNQKEDVEAFEKEVSEKGLSSYYQVTTNLDQISGETESISNVSNFATLFLIITLIIGGVVLFVINMINIRERKYEIGVLRTIGMKKSKVTLQFIIELFIVTFVALIIGTGIGAVLSVPTANSLLKHEIESAEEQQNNIGGHFGQINMTGGNSNLGSFKPQGVTDIAYIDHIDAIVDFKVILELLALGIGLTLFSSLASMMAVARFEPIKILKERT